MKNVMQQIVNYFDQAYNMEVKFSAYATGFTGSVVDSKIIYRSEELEAVSIVWEDDGNFNMFSVTVMMGELEMSDQTRQYLNAYNIATYGWKAIVGTGTPYLAFKCEFEYVNPDKIQHILGLAFSELCSEDNEVEFYDLVSKQLKKQ